MSPIDIYKMVLSNLDKKEEIIEKINIRVNSGDSSSTNIDEITKLIIDLTTYELAYDNLQSIIYSVISTNGNTKKNDLTSDTDGDIKSNII